MQIFSAQTILRVSILTSFLMTLNHCGRVNDASLNEERSQFYPALLGHWKNVTLPIENNGSGIEVGENMAGVEKDIALTISQNELLITQTCKFEDGNQIQTQVSAAVKVGSDYIKILEPQQASTSSAIGSRNYLCFVKLEPKVISFRLQEYYELDGKKHALDEPTLELVSFATFKKTASSTN